jgi:hypothetical protein
MRSILTIITYGNANNSRINRIHTQEIKEHGEREDPQGNILCLTEGG